MNLLLLPIPAGGHGGAADVLLALTILLVAAKLGGELAMRLRQPAVLGELLAGLVLGGIALLGFERLELIRRDAIVEAFAQVGVILLLFEVGLESTVRDMLRVGPAALAVAVIGVVAPFALGWGVGALLLPDASVYTHVFLGATLTATSVGITARVLQDLGRSRSPEARVILGAAVIDDVLGLLVLAVVAGVIASADRGEAFSSGAIGLIVGKSLGFLVGALLLGSLLARPLFAGASRMRGRGVALITALAFCFAFAWAADGFGLAPIVGAYAAGLVLEHEHFKAFVARGEEPLEQSLRPVTAFFVPLFFVLMGLRVDLTVWGSPRVLGLAALLTIAAIVGKQFCALGVPRNGLDRLSVGIGMVPRGEVGLIFANLGLGLTVAGERIVDDEIFAAVVVMVVVTTMVTPPALEWSLSRAERRASRTTEPERSAAT